MIGLGQFNAGFVSPDDPYDGVDDWTALSGLEPGDPSVNPTIGAGHDPFLAPEVISQRVTTTQTPSEISGHSHWSDLFNLDSPMPFLLVLVLVMVGIVQLQISARIGRR